MAAQIGHTDEKKDDSLIKKMKIEVGMEGKDKLKIVTSLVQICL